MNLDSYNWLCYFRKKVSPRQPKLFFVSSKYTTSTITTSTFCYSTLASVTAACRRKKKRAIVDEVLVFSDNIEGEETYEHISSGMDDAAPSSERYVGNTRKVFIKFWRITKLMDPWQVSAVLTDYHLTSTSSLTSYTASSTLFVSCVPSGIISC